MARRTSAAAERRAFVGAIQEAPDDDTPRLVYADWLDDHVSSGDSPSPHAAGRAEFIRVQCRLAGPSEDDPGRPVLEQRESALLRQHQAEWLGPWHHSAVDALFGRGFLEGIRISRHADTGFGLDLLSGAVSPYLATLRVGDAGLRALLESPHLRRLETLRLATDHLTPAGVEAVLTFPRAKQLQKLVLHVPGYIQHQRDALIRRFREHGVRPTLGFKGDG